MTFSEWMQPFIDWENGMKLIIAGGRDYRFNEKDFSRINFIESFFRIDEIVSGGATGADAGGEAWANKNGVKITRFLPDWKLNGRAAGPMRNRLMAEYADAVALFPGGRGTESMLKEVKRAGIKVYDFRGMA